MSIAELEAQLKTIQAQITAAKAAAANERGELIAAITAAISPHTAALAAAEIGTFTVRVSPDGVQVSFPGASGSPRTRTAPGALTVPAEGICRTYKGQPYRLIPCPEGFTVEGSGVDPRRTFRSCTAAAQAVIGSEGSINGRDWWRVA
jgi:hypothetical protein